MAASACGPPLLRASTYPATAESSSSAGTALLIRPACATRAAGTRSPSSNNSIPSRRFIRSRHTTEITAGATPTRTSESEMHVLRRDREVARGDQSVAATGNVALHPRDGGFGAVQDAFEHRHQSAGPGR